MRFAMCLICIFDKHGSVLIAVTFSTVDQTIRDTIVETKLLKQYTLLPTLTCMWVQVETCENLFN